MDSYTRSLIDRYHERQAERKDYELHSLRIAELFDFPLDQRPLTLLGLLTPLLAIAWSDGKIGVHEQDAIMRAGEIYGILTDEAASKRLVTLLTSRPTTGEIDDGWQTISRVSYALPPDELTVFTSLLYQQVKFVGELGQKHSFGHLIDFQLGQDEAELLHITQDRVADIMNEAVDAAEHPELAELREVDERLMQLIPLVKVAWADGRVSKRERQMIFDSISHFGIERTPENIAKLAEWLDLQPDDAFFQHSLEKLGFQLADRENDTLQTTKYEIISRCTLVADASGTYSKDEGFRICDEEIHTVKEIAKILNGRFA
ncbi:MAG: hypothetical protein IPG58_00730 [Acidobacteria bacterium]|nr:hypothetical protein [Acidobacteriota bacterium]